MYIHVLIQCIFNVCIMYVYTYYVDIIICVYMLCSLWYLIRFGLTHWGPTSHERFDASLENATRVFASVAHDIQAGPVPEVLKKRSNDNRNLLEPQPFGSFWQLLKSRRRPGRRVPQATCNCDLTCCTAAPLMHRICFGYMSGGLNRSRMSSINVFPIEVKSLPRFRGLWGKGKEWLFWSDSNLCHSLFSPLAPELVSFHYSLDRNRKSEQGPTYLEITTYMTDVTRVSLRIAVFLSFNLPEGSKCSTTPASRTVENIQKRLQHVNKTSCSTGEWWTRIMEAESSRRTAMDPPVPKRMHKLLSKEPEAWVFRSRKRHEDYSEVHFLLWVVVCLILVESVVIGQSGGSNIFANMINSTVHEHRMI